MGLAVVLHLDTVLRFELDLNMPRQVLQVGYSLQYLSGQIFSQEIATDPSKRDHKGIICLTLPLWQGTRLERDMVYEDSPPPKVLERSCPTTWRSARERGICYN